MLCITKKYGLLYTHFWLGILLAYFLQYLQKYHQFQKNRWMENLKTISPLFFFEEA
jgi:hypothetical protein